MSNPVMQTGAAPETRNRDFLVLVVGASVAPLFWLGQLMLGYAVTAYACFPGDAPVAISFAAALRTALIVFDVAAIIAAVLGGIVSLWGWRRADTASSGTVAGRMRFLGLWGIFSSLWFFCAILFNTIASLMVPPCAI